MNGGLWLDANTVFVNENSINLLFEKYKNFDFVITVIPLYNFDMASGAMLSKKKSKLALDILNKIKQNLSNHYNLENNSNEYIPYNFFMFVAPVVCYELLEYKFFEEFRNNVKKIYTENNNDILTLDLPKFREYNCGLMEISNYLKFYGCNMDHHLGDNIHLHWSNLQKTQKLFYK